MEKKEPIDTNELLRKFLAGELTFKEEQVLRAAAADDPFLAEAMEGIDASGEMNHVENLASIRKSLQPKAKEKTRMIPLRWIGSAAAVGLLLVLSTWLWNRGTGDDGSFSKKEEKIEQAEKPSSDKEEQIRTEYYALDSTGEMAVFDSSIPEIENEVVEEKAEINLPSAGKQKSVQFSSTPSESTQPIFEEVQETPPAVVAPPRAFKKSKPIDTNKNENVEKPDIQVENESPEFVAEAESKKVEEISKDEKQMSNDDAAVAYTTESGLLVEEDFNTHDSNYVYKGSVFDNYGEPLIGANVVVPGTKVGAVTDFQGNFVISTPFKLPIMEANYIGYESSAFRPIESKNELAIYMAESSVSLDEVVISNSKSKSRKSGRTTSMVSTEPTSIYKPAGGYNKFRKYIKKNQKGQNAWLKKNPTVVLEFLIPEDGRPTEIEITESGGPSADLEAIRLLQEGPKWNSRNKGVETRAMVRIEF